VTCPLAGIWQTSHCQRATQRVYNTQYQCELHGRFARFKVHNKSHTNPGCQRQLGLCKTQLLAGQSQSGTQISRIAYRTHKVPARDLFDGDKHNVLQITRSVNLSVHCINKHYMFPAREIICTVNSAAMQRLIPTRECGDQQSVSLLSCHRPACALPPNEREDHPCFPIFQSQ